MGLKANYNSSDIDKMLAAKLANVNKAIIQTLSFIGEQCVNEAREFGSYHDQTGNLRSSVGYVIVANGSVIKYNFKRANNGGGNGVIEGKAYANRIAYTFRKGYTLIVVAGMNYAALVEARGRNVLDSAESLARIQVPILMAQLKAKANKAA